MATKVDQPLFQDVLNLVSQQCAACNRPDIHPLAAQIDALAKKYQVALEAQHDQLEEEAHATSNAEYSQLVMDIKARAQASGWPAQCQ